MLPPPASRSRPDASADGGAGSGYALVKVEPATPQQPDVDDDEQATAGRPQTAELDGVGETAAAPEAAAAAALGGGAAGGSASASASAVHDEAEPLHAAEALQAEVKAEVELVQDVVARAAVRANAAREARAPQAPPWRASPAGPAHGAVAQNF